MFAPPPSPPPAWIAQPSPEEIARAEAAAAPGAFLAAMKPEGAAVAMSCIVVADGRLADCQPEKTPESAPQLQAAARSVARAYRLDPTDLTPGSRITVTPRFPRLFDKPPEIVSRPSRAEIAAAFPRGGFATVVCRIDVQGALDRCAVNEAEQFVPKTEAAVLRLATMFKLRPASLGGAPTPTFVGLEISTDGPVTINMPRVLRQPTRQELLSALPAAAVNAGEDGDALIRCGVLLSGVLSDCVVISEKPAGFGFGSAALTLARLFVMTPKTINGEPVPNAPVHIPIHWEGMDPSVAGPHTFRVLPWVAWAKAPGAAETAAAFPAKAATRRVFGHVTLRCALSAKGVPRDCETQLETPEGDGFAAAARRLAPTFQAQVSDLTPAQLRDGRVMLAFDFSERALAAFSGSYLRGVDWVRGFDLKAEQAAYPDAAIKAGVRSGRAIADCQVGPDGSLADCSASGDDPAGLGFGAAAVRLAQVMRANLWTQDGEPTPGQRVRVPIRLVYADDPKPPAQTQPAAASPH